MNRTKNRQTRTTVMSSAPTDWQANDYAKNSCGQLAWALSLLDRAELGQQESVLDIGCGDGKITAEIAKRVPGGRVVGIDSSTNMVALAERTWNTVPNLTFHRADAQQLALPEMFDVAFSNSTLHWVPDHLSVLKGVADSLKPGGRIIFSMGGRGTAALVYTVLEELQLEQSWGEYLADAESPHHFHGVEEYEKWLPQSGFTADRVALVPKPMRHADEAALRGWIRTTWVPYTNRIPAALRDEFTGELTSRVRERCGVNDEGAILLPMVNLEVQAHKN